MSNSKQEGSVRQLPAGKLSNIKKLFENGDSGTQGKTDRPMPPARPAAPPSRGKSPARHQHSGPQVQQHQASLASWAAEHALQHKDQSNRTERKSSLCENTEQNVEGRDHRKLSPTISRRITALMDSASSSQQGASQQISQPPKPIARHIHETGSGGNSVVVDNPVYSGFQDRSTTGTDVKDMYSKVNKTPKPTDSSPKKVKWDSQEFNIHRREAVRKNTGERRNTVASFDTENNDSELGVSVALRTKLFDAPKADKPAPPLKPEPVKRQFSMRTSRELEQQQQLTPRIRSDSGPCQEAVYDPPWDTSKNAILEKLRNTQSTAISSPATKADSSSGIKVNAPPKPPLPNIPFKKGESVLQKAADKASINQQSTPRNPLKPKPLESNVAPPVMKTGPPPKPPRTHAHDHYLKVRISDTSDLATRKTVSIVEPGSDGKEQEEETEYLSVKDRISKMQHQNDSVSSGPPPLPSTSFTNKEQNVQMRHQPPSRPPPPKRRPNSGGNQVTPPSLPVMPRPRTQAPISANDGPIVIPVSPRHQQPLGKTFSNWPELHSRRPSDQLPPEPEGGRTLQRFPLRKSYSSECLHSSRGSSLNGEISDLDSMTQSTYGYQYEAVIDADGYAVPHEFMRLPSRKKHSVQHENVENVSPTKFLARFEGFGGGIASRQNAATKGPGVTSIQDQSLDKVNKKKMIMVKQKINQAYADVDISMRGLVDTSTDNDWQVVDQRSVDATELVVEPTELKKRVQYCTSVRLKSSRSIKRSKEYLSAIYPQLFEYCLVVGLRPLVESNEYEPFVIHKFPENVSSNLSVPNFCFPDASIFKPGSVTSVSESYSFVMTYADGSRVYGYCRRIQPPDTSLPEVICIISPIDAFNMYNTLLNEVEARRRISSDLASELIAASFGRPLPKPGKVCHIRTLDNNGEMETIFLTRQCDNKLENVNYESPLHFLGTDKLVKVFSSMLMERRIMLCSSNLSVLTQTVHALAALLYPFHWQHVYIPLLPGEMLDVVCAPMPYIVGVLTAFLPQMLKMDLEEVFIVDLDKKNIVKSQGDESTILPRKIQRALKTAINMCKIDTDAQNAQWLMVAEAFLRMFIETVGHFTNHIRTQQDGNRIFQKEGFISEVVSKELRQFLEWFTETQMFEVFIVNQLEKSDGTSDLFMQRLTEHRESKEESSRHKGLGAKVKNFGKVLKTKLQAS